MRAVSLVPSLTEAVAVSSPGLIVGATDWCTHPADLRGATRIGGTKNPDVAAVVALRPDLVIANEEENRAPDVQALRAAGLEVLVTVIRDLPQALSELELLLVDALGLARPGWLADAGAAWARVEPVDRRRAFVPVWRRPWMVLGRDTFAGDLLARLGVENAYADHAERYPRVPAEELRAAGCDLVVLPDEPYRFTVEDGPEAFPGLPAALVSGRHLTWYGPSLAEAPRLLAEALRGA
ncbi:helical backbone metal receptor [Streptomyces sp. G-G2]|uniref:helical backbone metal receptor n=1 Tax=Streptomyces sp. G-G2 TaxID=3046201 RepID=UPI0024BA5D93|nr:helical backbone metal receptor [Streptomyces sp. G-G2]MDJ0381645.1 helical backbone metal receptor [Streptomyces sp. G-G2]